MSRKKPPTSQQLTGALRVVATSATTPMHGPGLMRIWSGPDRQGRETHVFVAMVSMTVFLHREGLPLRKVDFMDLVAAMLDAKPEPKD